MLVKARRVAARLYRRAMACIKYPFVYVKYPLIYVRRIDPITFIEKRIVQPMRFFLLRLLYKNEVGRFIHLRDLPSISDEQWTAARSIGAKIGTLRDRRNEIISAKGLDPATALPGGHWSVDGSLPIFRLFEIVRKADYQTINNLRLFSYTFSGFYLAHLARAQGVTGLGPPELTEEFHAQLDRRATEPPPSTVLDFCKMIRRIPPSLRARPPKMLGEIGWDVDGSPVNTDTRSTQARLNTFYETGIIAWLQDRLARRGYLTIMEIGAGVGDVCYALSRVFAPCRFIICDLPESLIFSATYLRLTVPQAKHFVLGVDGDQAFERPPDGIEFIYVPNFAFGDLSNVKVDFAYNFGSFEEMTAAQVRQYGTGLSVMLAPDGLLLDLNELYGCNSKQVLAGCFPFRRNPLMKTFIAKNSVDLWGTQPIQALIPAEQLPLKNYGFEWFWRLRQRAIAAGLLKLVVFAE